MTDKQKSIDWILPTLRESAWAPLSILVFYLIALAFHFFDLFPPLDIPTHLAGGMALTYFYRSAIRNSQGMVGDIPPSIQILFAFTCTATTTVLWEFYENLLDYFLHTHVVNGLFDTLKDLFFGLLGALVFSAFYRRR